MNADFDSSLLESQRSWLYQDGNAKPMDDQAPTAEAHLQRARLQDEGLVFDSPQEQQQAFECGMFFLEIPPGVDVSAGDEFARQFYRGATVKPYGQFRNIKAEKLGDPLVGFQQRTNNQVEQFILERRFWQKYYPPEIAALARSLTQLSLQILQSTLKYVGIPESVWSKATGGCIDTEGTYYLTFNHYRPILNQIGVIPHKDDGFITILRTTTPGLEIDRKDHWEMVPADPDSFVINFGLSMQLLTSRCRTPIGAIVHRVARQCNDRLSFGHFSLNRSEPRDDTEIYRYLPNLGLERLCGSSELMYRELGH